MLILAATRLKKKMGKIRYSATAALAAPGALVLHLPTPVLTAAQVAVLCRSCRLVTLLSVSAR